MTRPPTSVATMAMCEARSGAVRGPTPMVMKTTPVMSSLHGLWPDAARWLPPMLTRPQPGASRRVLRAHRGVATAAGCLVHVCGFEHQDATQLLCGLGVGVIGER